MINKQNLNKFLKEAKINTYAGGGEGGEIKLKDGGKKFEYKKGSFCYQDIYFGFNPFIGQEIIFYNQKPVWSMNYYGQVIIKAVPAEKVYLFLRQALSKVTEVKPFRGPASFNKDNFKYTNSIKGQVENFSGQEKIFYKEKLVYKLKYHGGFIKSK